MFVESVSLAASLACARDESTDTTRLNREMEAASAAAISVAQPLSSDAKSEERDEGIGGSCDA
jgi:hypothetical protein